MSENYFYLNRNQRSNVLYFKEWLPNVYLLKVKTLRRNNVNIAESQYRQELEEAITTYVIKNGLSIFSEDDEQFCRRGWKNNNIGLCCSSKGAVQGIHHSGVGLTLGSEQHQKFYKEAWMKEKEKRQAMEQERNKVKLGNSCSEATIVAYIEIVRHLECLDPAMIKPEVPLASGIINLSRNEDPFVNLLSSRSKQILMHHKFGNNEFLGEIKFMVDDLVDTYKDLKPDFDPVLMRPIAFLQGEMSIESRRILMAVFDLLEGLQHIWSLRPLLIEDDYSENSYVIHAVSKVLDPIFTYSKWSLKPRSINVKLGKVPVLGIQVIRDRVVVSALDLFEDNFYRVFQISELVILLYISSCLIVEEFLKNTFKMRFVVEKIIAMSVDVKDEISLLLVTKDRTPSTSFMLTTYSPPKNL
ncbi:20976_t:CDS:2 [Cetraspora pellucida]|uniref:20976_t:CDS:1 n=1 Tax=Cetraspora pellucida TaxID=1433469 RepID=A0A9N9P0U4_9GLOM|nr:20976_t:CDS:2 [Cetraspora pellucida]